MTWYAWLFVTVSGSCGFILCAMLGQWRQERWRQTAYCQQRRAERAEAAERYWRAEAIEEHKRFSAVVN